MKGEERMSAKTKLMKYLIDIAFVLILVLVFICSVTNTYVFAQWPPSSGAFISPGFSPINPSYGNSLTSSLNPSYGFGGLANFGNYVNNPLPYNLYSGYGLYAGYSPSLYGSYGSFESSGSNGLYGYSGSPYYPYTPSYPAPPPIPDDDEYEYVSAVEAKDQYVYLAVAEGAAEENSQYLWVVDVSDPDNPERVKRISIGRYPSMELYLQGNYLYWISQSEDNNDFDYDIEDEGMVGVFDISDPDNPSLIDTLTIDIAQANFPVATFDNDRFYLLYSDFNDEDMEDEGILVQIDISSPQNLHLLSTSHIDFKSNININQLVVKDNLAFMAADDIYIFNLSDPQNPIKISKFEYDKGRINDLALSDHFLLGTASEAGLLIVDLEYPNNPQLITVVEMAWPQQIFLKDHKAYVSDYCKGLYAVDLSDPEAPELIHGYRLPSHKLFESTNNSSSGFLSDAAVEGDLAFTVSYAHLQIWDISERENIEMTGKIGPDHEALGSTGEIIEGELTVILTKEAVSSISLGDDGDIATFGISSLDELNNDFGVSKITKVTKSWETLGLINDLDDFDERTFVIGFSKSVDTFEVWDAYMDNPYCLIAEFSYEPNNYSDSGGYGIIPYYSPGGYGVGGYGLGGYGFNPYTSPFSFPMSVNQAYFSPQYYPAAGPWSMPSSINTSSWNQSSLFPSSLPNIYLNSLQNIYPNFQNTFFPGGNNPWTYPAMNPMSIPAYPMWDNVWSYGPMGGFPNPYPGAFGF